PPWVPQLLLRDLFEDVSQPQNKRQHRQRDDGDSEARSQRQLLATRNRGGLRRRQQLRNGRQHRQAGVMLRILTGLDREKAAHLESERHDRSQQETKSKSSCRHQKALWRYRLLRQVCRVNHLNTAALLFARGVGAHVNLLLLQQQVVVI